MEERPPIWKVAANILYKQWRTAGKGWFPQGLVEAITTPHRENVSCYEIFTDKSLGPGLILRYDLSNEKGRWIFRKWDVGVWTGLSWLRIGTVGGQL
jgi:hypothetical protein